MRKNGRSGEVEGGITPAAEAGEGLLSEMMLVNRPSQPVSARALTVRLTLRRRVTCRVDQRVWGQRDQVFSDRYPGYRGLMPVDRDLTLNAIDLRCLL